MSRAPRPRPAPRGRPPRTFRPAHPPSIPLPPSRSPPPLPSPSPLPLARPFASAAAPAAPRPSLTWRSRRGYKEEKAAAEAAEAKLLAEAQAQAATAEVAVPLPARFGAVYTCAAAVAALATSLFFADRWHMRAQYDLIVLGGIGAAVFFALSDAYHHQAAAAVERAVARLRAAPRAKPASEASRAACAEEGAYYALFVVNFWFVAIFAALALGIAPLVLESPAAVVVPAGDTPITAAWVHCAISSLPAALLVFLNGRSII